MLVDGRPMVGALLDLGLHFFHNAEESLARGHGPFYYLPKMESHLEARLWNDIFTHAQAALGVPHGSVRAPVLIETIPAAFEMEEILSTNCASTRPASTRGAGTTCSASSRSSATGATVSFFPTVRP